MPIECIFSGLFLVFFKTSLIAFSCVSQMSLGLCSTQPSFEIFEEIQIEKYLNISFLSIIKALELLVPASIESMYFSIL